MPRSCSQTLRGVERARHRRNAHRHRLRPVSKGWDQHGRRWWGVLPLHTQEGEPAVPGQVIDDADKCHIFGGIERDNLIALDQSLVCPLLVCPDQAILHRGAEVDFYALHTDLLLLPPAGLAIGSSKQPMNAASWDSCTGSAHP